MPPATTEFVWQPDEETLDRANVVRLMRNHGVDDYWELVRRSQEDPEWFWPAAIEDMGLEFSQPWERVVDLSRGPEWATWFVGGKLNIAWNCVHRWAERRPHAIASVGLGEDGSHREQTFGELSREVTRLAEALLELGVEPGDRVAIFLPMSPEVPIASHAPGAGVCPSTSSMGKLCVTCSMSTASASSPVRLSCQSSSPTSSSCLQERLHLGPRHRLLLHVDEERA